MKNKLKKAFTITELVIVIAVIAILAAVLIPTFSNVISNAKKSAALQTCSNALKDYSATAAGAGETENEGTVFVSDGYVYVYLNSTLQYVGKTDDLVSYNASGNFNKTTLNKATLTGVADTTTPYSSITIVTNYTVDSVSEKVGEKEIKKDELVKEEGENAKQVESVFFYTIEVNKTNYFGYFTLEGGSAKYQTQGASYSRVYGFANVDKYTVVITANA